MNRIVLSFKDSPRKPLGRRPIQDIQDIQDSPSKPLRRRPFHALNQPTIENPRTEPKFCWSLQPNLEVYLLRTRGRWNPISYPRSLSAPFQTWPSLYPSFPPICRSSSSSSMRQNARTGCGGPSGSRLGFIPTLCLHFCIKVSDFQWKAFKQLKLVLASVSIWRLSKISLCIRCKLLQQL